MGGILGSNMIKTNYDEWPIVQVESPSKVTDEEMAIHLEEFANQIKRRDESCVVVLDLRVCEKLSVTQRKMITQSMLKMDARNRMIGCAMVFESTLLRGMLTEMFWMHRPRYPTRIFTTMDEANEWAQMLTPRVRAQIRPATFKARPIIRRAPAHSRRPPADSRNMVRAPRDGNWIVHFDASRNRTRAANLVDALRATDCDAFLCERRVSPELSLWLGWTGPYHGRDDAFAARDNLAKRGVLLTVSQWSAGRAD